MAIVAQLVEHLVVVQDVAGSSPVDRPFRTPSDRGQCVDGPEAIAGDFMCIAGRDGGRPTLVLQRRQRRANTSSFALRASANKKRSAGALTRAPLTLISHAAGLRVYGQNSDSQWSQRSEQQSPKSQQRSSQ